MDREAYTTIIFDFCSQSALTKRNVVEDIFEEGAETDQVAYMAMLSYDLLIMGSQTVLANWGDDVLRYILRVCLSNTIFSTFEPVFVKWLDAVSQPSASIEVLLNPATRFWD